MKMKGKPTIRIVLLAVAAAAAATACTPQRGFTLLGEVPKVWEGKSVVLYAVDGAGAEPIDSTRVTDGKFRLKGELATPRRCRGVIYLDPNDRTSRRTQCAFDVLLDSTEVTVRCLTEGQKQRFTLSGGASQEALTAFRNETATLSREHDRLFDQYVESFYHRADRRQGIELARELTQIDRELTARRIDYIRTHPASGVSPLLLGELTAGAAAPTRDTLTRLFEGLDIRLRNSVPGQRLAETIRTKHMLVGETLPDLEVSDAQGATLRLGELLRPGSCTLVEVWASWCAPCRDDIPYLREAYDRYRQQGFDIVGISVDTQRDAWLQALAEEKMPWRQFNDPARRCFEAFETGSVPTSILVDDGGRILRIDARGGWLGAELENLYDETLQ